MLKKGDRIQTDQGNIAYIAWVYSDDEKSANGGYRYTGEIETPGGSFINTGCLWKEDGSRHDNKGNNLLIAPILKPYETKPSQILNLFKIG